MYSQNIKNQGNHLAKKTKDILAKYRMFVDINVITPIKNGFVLEATPKPGFWVEATKCEKILCMQLKYPFIHVKENKTSILITVSQQESIDNRLIPVLKHPQFEKATMGIQMPYVVGFNHVGEPIIADFAKNPTWLDGGSPGYGKTVVLMSLATNMIYNCSPDDLEILIVDGSAELTAFETICTVTNDASHALDTLVYLREDMEPRIALRNENPAEYKSLKYRAIIIDEYPALVTSVGGNKKLLTENVLAIIQRARHAKYIICIAAQNPKLDNMGNLDLASVSARVCLHCEKPVYSRTILDSEDGAYLEEPGKLIFRSRQFRGDQRLTGSLVTPEEIPAIINEIRAKHGDGVYYGLELDEVDLIKNVNKEKSDDILFAKIIMWTLEHSGVSGNLIDTTFKTGERAGRAFIDRLYQFGIVGEQVSTKRRTVIPSAVQELTEDAIAFLKCYDYSEKDIENAFISRG